MPVEAPSGDVVDAGGGDDSAGVLAARGIACEAVGGDPWCVGSGGIDAGDPSHLRATVGGVPVTLLRRPTRPFGPPDPSEVAEFLRLFEVTRRPRPDVLVAYGGDPLTQEVLGLARRAGIPTVFVLHDFPYTLRTLVDHADADAVPSRYFDEEYARLLGLARTPLPCVVDPA